MRAHYDHYIEPIHSPGSARIIDYICNDCGCDAADWVDYLNSVWEDLHRDDDDFDDEDTVT